MNTLNPQKGRHSEHSEEPLVEGLLDDEQRSLRQAQGRLFAALRMTRNGGVRFQGEIPLEDNRSYLDRTTLTPLPDGRVRQVIEWSTDGGETWNIAFDAYYIREE